MFSLNMNICVCVCVCVCVCEKWETMPVWGVCVYYFLLCLVHFLLLVLVLVLVVLVLVVLVVLLLLLHRYSQHLPLSAQRDLHRGTPLFTMSDSRVGRADNHALDGADLDQSVVPF